MYEMIVNPPENLARAPFNCVAMDCFGCIEPELDMAWGASIAVVVVCSLSTWVVEDINQEAVWSIPRDLNIYLLSWRVTVKKEPGDHARHVRSLDSRFESSEQVLIPTAYRSRTIVSNT
jgi:hypothetical protein